LGAAIAGALIIGEGAGIPLADLDPFEGGGIIRDGTFRTVFFSST
jgi:hypothetical protein